MRNDDISRVITALPPWPTSARERKEPEEERRNSPIEMVSRETNGPHRYGQRRKTTVEMGTGDRKMASSKAAMRQSPAKERG